MRYKLGLKTVEAQPRVMLRAYYTSDLPPVDSLPKSFGHANLITPHMFLNDRIGDCAIAGSIEEVRLANALAGKTVNFDDADAIANYSEITGYQPGSEIADPQDAPPNPTDQGTDVHELYDFRQSTGIVDADGNRHKVVAYAGLTPGDFDELLVALSLFDMVGIGIQVPDYCDAQFEAGQPWHLVKGHHSIEGGHYIPVVGRDDATTASLYTWGGVGGITEGFYSKYNTVAVVALTEEMLNGDKNIDGVDQETLARDLPQLNTGPVMSKAPKDAA